MPETPSTTKQRWLLAAAAAVLLGGVAAVGVTEAVSTANKPGPYMDPVKLAAASRGIEQELYDHDNLGRHITRYGCVHSAGHRFVCTWETNEGEAFREVMLVSKDARSWTPESEVQLH